MLIPLIQLRKILLANQPIDEPIDRVTATGITTDTRILKSGEIFVALEGDNFDGHNFAAQAVDKGAVALVVSRKLTLKQKNPPVYSPRYFSRLSTNCPLVARSLFHTDYWDYRLSWQNYHQRINCCCSQYSRTSIKNSGELQQRDWGTKNFTRDNFRTQLCCS